MKRDNFTMPLGFSHELLIDNFAGGGGASTGIEQAFGRAVDVAINHDGEALAMHEANHPTTRHYREDVFTVHGEEYQIVDIGMRMLTPRELARAQGFPDDYVLVPVVNGKPLSKTAQVRMIGNSVCPPLARALLVANFTHEQQIARTA